MYLWVRFPPSLSLPKLGLSINPLLLKYISGLKLPLTFNSQLLFFFINFTTSSYITNLKGSNGLPPKRDINKIIKSLALLPIFPKISKKSTYNSAYHNTSKSIHLHYYIRDLSNITSLFYSLGFLNKKILFLSTKGQLIKLCSTISSQTLGNNNLPIIRKINRSLSLEKIFINKYRLSNAVKKLNAYCVVFLSLPMNFKLIKVLCNLSKLTVGVSNLNHLDINIPTYNSWLSYKVALSFKLYDMYRLGYYNRLESNHVSLFYQFKKVVNAMVSKNIN